MFNDMTQKANEIARQFSADFPPSLQEMKSHKDADKFRRALLQFKGNIIAYQKKEKMWFIRRIVFARALQGELLQIGYLTNTVRRIMSDGISALTFGK